MRYFEKKAISQRTVFKALANRVENARERNPVVRASLRAVLRSPKEILDLPINSKAIDYVSDINKKFPKGK